MKEVLKSFKKYSITDYIKIPLLICPVWTVTIGILHIVAALIPALTVLATAGFIDTAIYIFNGKLGYSRIYTPLIFLFLILLYEQLHRTFIYNFAYLHFEMAVFKQVKFDMLEKRSKLEYRHIEDNETWDLVARTCDEPSDKIASGLNNLFDAAEITIIIFSISLILFSKAWYAGLLIMVISVPFLFLAAKCGKEVYTANVEAGKIKRYEAYLGKILMDRENVEERTLFSYSSAINQKWNEKYEQARKISLKTEAKNFIRMKGSSLITITVSMVIIGILLILVSDKTITTGIFISLSTAAYNVVQMLSWRLAYSVKTLAESNEYMKDLTSFMALSEVEGALELPTDIKNMHLESIEFKNVSFKYPKTENYILKNLDLKLVKNKHYAIVGINGAGKTTLTKLLTGMYDNYTGEILINGMSLRDYKLPELKAIFSVVYQDFAKYFITFRDNILLGDTLHIQRDIDEKEAKASIDKILRDAGLTEVIKKLPHGLDTYLGKIKENGMDLSGGEWQRLAVARSLYNPALVRILDEPAASIDPIVESSLYQMFKEKSVGNTTIFITHRLGAARKADEIIVINKGQAAEIGTHEELLKLGGIYADMFESQRSWYQQ